MLSSYTPHYPPLTSSPHRGNEECRTDSRKHRFVDGKSLGAIIPGALIFQHPLEGPPSHIQNGPRETPVPRYVQVLHHQNRLGFRQLTCAGSPGGCRGCCDARRDTAFSSLKLFACAPVLSRATAAFFCFRERCFERRPFPEVWGHRSLPNPTVRHVDAQHILRFLDLPGLGIQALLTNERTASREMVAERTRAFSD